MLSYLPILLRPKPKFTRPNQGLPDPSDRAALRPSGLSGRAAIRASGYLADQLSGRMAIRLTSYRTDQQSDRLAIRQLSDRLAIPKSQEMVWTMYPN